MLWLEIKHYIVLQIEKREIVTFNEMLFFLFFKYFSPRVKI